MESGAKERSGSITAVRTRPFLKGRGKKKKEKRKEKRKKEKTKGHILKGKTFELTFGAPGQVSIYIGVDRWAE
jgi:hypothetical protein